VDKNASERQSLTIGKLSFRKCGKQVEKKCCTMLPIKLVIFVISKMPVTVAVKSIVD
jgi:hypothetical protein